MAKEYARSPFSYRELWGWIIILSCTFVIAIACTMLVLNFQDRLNIDPLTNLAFTVITWALLMGAFSTFSANKRDWELDSPKTRRGRFVLWGCAILALVSCVTWLHVTPPLQGCSDAICSSGR